MPHSVVTAVLAMVNFRKRGRWKIRKVSVPALPAHGNASVCVRVGQLRPAGVRVDSRPMYMRGVVDMRVRVRSSIPLNRTRMSCARTLARALARANACTNARSTELQEHSVDAVDEYDRGGQLLHGLLPAVALYVPALHLVHGPLSGPVKPGMHLHATLAADDSLHLGHVRHGRLPADVTGL